MRLLLLLAVLAGGAWFGPQVMQGAESPCQALELRVASLVRDEAGRLPPELAGNPRLRGLLGLARDAAAASSGMVAQTYIRDRFPDLPPEPACAVGWWKLKFDPDLGPYIRGYLARQVR